MNGETVISIFNKEKSRMKKLAAVWLIPAGSLTSCREKETQNSCLLRGERNSC
jgi:hypothetical protein